MFSYIAKRFLMFLFVCLVAIGFTPGSASADVSSRTSLTASYQAANPSSSYQAAKTTPPNSIDDNSSAYPSDQVLDVRSTNNPAPADKVPDNDILLIVAIVLLILVWIVFEFVLNEMRTNPPKTTSEQRRRYDRFEGEQGWDL